LEKAVEISIIIKALNEEEHIKRCIQSVISACKGFKAEIILADSLSTDRTVAIAKKHNIRIVQLRNVKDRSCGVGPQLGYQHAKGELIYILDGDMELENKFLYSALKSFREEPRMAGVAGQVEEMRTVNLQFKRRKNQKHKPVGLTDRLEMGGLYRREAIKSVEYFSNANLHAYEEAELGLRLRSKGWLLKRLKVPGIKHYGYDTDSLGVFRKRFKTRYIKGSGEFLRASIGKNYWFKTVTELKIYIALATWWLLLVAALALSAMTTYPIIILASLAVMAILALLVRKKDVSEAAFSIVSWHYSTVGLVWGLLSPQKEPTRRIPSKVIS